VTNSAKPTTVAPETPGHVLRRAHHGERHDQQRAAPMASSASWLMPSAHARLKGRSRSVCALGLSLVALVDGCALLCRPAVVFPKVGKPMAIPVRDPLLGPDPSAEAAIVSASLDVAAPTPFWLKISSAHAGVVLRPGKLLEPSKPDGDTVRGHTSSRVPNLLLGGVDLRDVLVTPGEIPLVGQTVLSHGPWEIDWDRGTLTLDAPPWPVDLPGATHVPLRRQDGVDIVVLDATGHSFDMALATASMKSRIPEPIGGVSTQQESPDLRSRVFEADATIGRLPVGFHSFEAPVEGREPYGALGLDVLACLRMRVEPGKQLWLAPRQETPQIARERIARWTALRGCRDVGCLQAHVESRSRPMAIALDVETPYPMSAVLVLSCRGDTHLVESEACNKGYWRFQHGQPVELEPHHVLVPIFNGVAGHIVRTVSPPEDFPSWEWPCSDLSLVDVVPLPSLMDKMPWRIPELVGEGWRAA
jgi:hypothetical protein